MWSRADLKSRAWEVLRTNYWTAFLVCLIYGAVMAFGGSFTAGIVALVLACFGSVGMGRYFMRQRKNQGDIADLAFGFQNEPGNVFVTTLLQNLFIMLWSLLFVVPGIIKALEYFFIPYILAENPHLDRKRVFEISRIMTDGEKANIFVLGISFLGWYILGCLTFGIGLLFLSPYVSATMAELYAAMRDKALYSGKVRADELPGF